MRAKKTLIRDGTTVDVMVRAIADRIVVGDLKPGGKLDEATLAERFAVSRTPIREALAQLAAILLTAGPIAGPLLQPLLRHNLHQCLKAWPNSKVSARDFQHCA